jgi:hypothetical protein
MFFVVCCRYILLLGLVASNCLGVLCVFIGIYGVRFLLNSLKDSNTPDETVGYISKNLCGIRLVEIWEHLVYRSWNQSIHCLFDVIFLADGGCGGCGFNVYFSLV